MRQKMKSRKIKQLEELCVCVCEYKDDTVSVTISLPLHGTHPAYHGSGRVSRADFICCQDT